MNAPENEKKSKRWVVLAVVLALLCVAVVLADPCTVLTTPEEPSEPGAVDTTDGQAADSTG